MIQFNQIEIIEFPVILGSDFNDEEDDNDQQTKNCRFPLQLSWEPQCRTVFDLIDYEINHRQSSSARRTTPPPPPPRPLRLTKAQRIELLQRNGVSVLDDSKRTTTTAAATTTRKQREEQEQEQLDKILKQIEQVHLRIEQVRQKLNTVNVEDDGETIHQKTVVVARCA